jgi:hypothetical protein
MTVFSTTFMSTNQPVTAAKLLIAAPQPVVRKIVYSETATFFHWNQSCLFGTTREKTGPISSWKDTAP